MSLLELELSAPRLQYEPEACQVRQIFISKSPF